MKTLIPALTVSLTLFLAACSGSADPSDDSASSESDSGQADTTIVPTEGPWTFGSLSWLSDECEAVFLSTPEGWPLSDATETGFDLDFHFEEESLVAAPSCELADADFSCETVEQSFSVGSGSILLQATSVGSFSADTTASVEVTFDLECSGSGCGSLMAANPCTSVQGFNSFYDG